MTTRDPSKPRIEPSRRACREGWQAAREQLQDWLAVVDVAAGQDRRNHRLAQEMMAIFRNRQRLWAKLYKRAWKP